jgi:hypothetical protein
VTPADPSRVLRRSILAWGLGHLAIGRRRTAITLFAAELVGLAGVAWLTAALADTTGYALPFAAGVAFLVAWGAQAVAAYRSARRALGTDDDPAPRASAAAIAWLSLPLLAWGTGFWLVAADAATPSAVLYRFIVAWDGGTLDDGSWPRTADAEARDAGRRLVGLCASGSLGGCDPEAGALRDVRMRVSAESSERATAVAEAVRFERRATALLGVFAGSELVPVSVERLLTLRLEARPAALGFRRWILVEVEGTSSADP